MADPKDSSSGDRTSVGVVPPVVPGAKPAPAGDAAAGSDAEGGSDRTQVLPAAPPVVPGASGGAGAAGAAGATPDRTQVLTAAPPAAPRPAEPSKDAPPPKQAAAAAPVGKPDKPGKPGGPADPATVVMQAPAEDGEDLDATVVMRRTEPTLRLLRTENTWTGAEAVLLEQPLYAVGRGRTADLKLFSPTSSREHARLEERDGAWFAEACEGKTLLVDDAVAEGEVELKPGMRLQMGDDEFVVAAASADGAGQAATGFFSVLLSWWRRLTSRSGG